MKQEIIDFYNQNNMPPYKVIEKGMQSGIVRHRMETAMEHCFNKIMFEGKAISPIDLFRYTLNVAQDLKENDFIFDNNLAEYYRMRFRHTRLIMYLSFAAIGIIHLILFIYYYPGY